MSDPTVLLVDDDDNILTVLSMRLRAAGYRVLTARDGDGAVAVIGQNGVDVVLSDLRLEREDGLDVMERVHALDNDLPVLILTAHGSIPNAVEALNRGAAGYLTKPVDREELLAKVARALQSRRLSGEVEALRRAVESRGELAGLVGVSAATRRVFELLEQHAPRRGPVALVGEPGSGRRAAARALHRLSSRANRPLVEVSCETRPEDALWRALFGAEGFPGAVARANGGTLLLAHADALPPSLAAPLLAVIRQSDLSPVATLSPSRLDLRVLASFRGDPLLLADEGALDLELAGRFSSSAVHLLPLRERPEDIPVLARFLLERLCEQLDRQDAAGQPAVQLSPDANGWLMRQEWARNAHDLEAVLRAAVEAAESDRIDGALLRKVGARVAG